MWEGGREPVPTPHPLRLSAQLAGNRGPLGTGGGALPFSVLSGSSGLPVRGHFMVTGAQPSFSPGGFGVPGRVSWGRGSVHTVTPVGNTATPPLPCPQLLLCPACRRPWLALWSCPWAARPPVRRPAGLTSPGGGAGRLRPGPPDVPPDQTAGSCRAQSPCSSWPPSPPPPPPSLRSPPAALRRPCPLSGPVGLTPPCSSPLRTLFCLLTPGSLSGCAQVCVPAGRVGTRVITVHTHKCVSLAGTRACAHLSGPGLTVLLVRTTQMQEQTPSSRHGCQATMAPPLCGPWGAGATLHGAAQASARF